jgi:hypothetical protein
LYEEITEKKCENDKVDDLKVEKVTGVAFWQNCNDAVSNNHGKLK